MLVACRLAGLSALGAHYAAVKGRAQRGRRGAPANGHCAGLGRAVDPQDGAQTGHRRLQTGLARP